VTATRKPWLIALVISVTLNLFLLGFGSARWLHARAHRDDSPGSFAPHGPPRHRGMFGPGSHLLRDALEPRREALRLQREQLRDARRALREALLAEPFDRAALQQALARLREATARSQHMMHDAVLETAPGLTREQRAELARSGRMFGARP
jgi:Spy/CpxP family protein refolding chaperone